MAGLGFMLALFAIFLMIGALLGWVAAFRHSKADKAMHQLELRIRELERAAGGKPPESRAADAASSVLRPPPETPVEQSTKAEPRRETRPEARPRAPAPPPAPEPGTTPKRPAFIAELIGNMRHNWMAWLGGISVSLAGIFLVGYSIEMGYLGPTARIVAAVIGGLALHTAAELFRRKTEVTHAAFAAMAGGGSITLYAAFYAALELYALIAPGPTFVLLAIVSFISMALAAVHGPLLAAIGILGAYFVPILVSEHAGGTLVELIYALIVTGGALYLIRFVYRPWLWLGTIAGALGWWLISLDGADADGFRGYYLAALALLVLVVPARSDAATDRLPVGKWFSVDATSATVLLIAIAQSLSIVNLGFTGFVGALFLWSPLIVVTIWASRERKSLAFAPWMLLALQLGAWLITALDEIGDRLVLAGLPLEVQSEFLGFAAAMAVIFSAGSALSRLGRGFSHSNVSLICLAPVAWLALCYLLVTDLSVDVRWGIGAVIMGLAYITVSGYRLQKEPDDQASLWLIMAAHLAYSLAAAMFFREATLTLALAIQVISLTTLRRRFELPHVGWLIKGVLAVVVARLTFNPWLLSYPIDVHWSLWTYGGSMLCCAVAARVCAGDVALRRWLEAASLHLLVLFLGAEVRYWLYDGEIFRNDFTLTESAINATLWGGLMLTYYVRSRNSENLAHFYLLCSRVLAVLALASYVTSLTFLNPLWGEETVGATKIWNLLLLAYGAPVVIATLAWFFYEPKFRKPAFAIAGLGLFAFVSLEIRHLWNGALDLAIRTTNGEAYTYSAAWLVMAVATMLAATRLGSRDGYRAGTGLLFIVIAKIFLFDMAELEGLLRVASFMGLGMALLGLAWLYQQTARKVA